MGFWDDVKKIFSGSGPREDLDKRFQKLAEAGQGSMCKIYRARDLKLGKTVALKILDRQRLERILAKDPPGTTRPSEGEIALQMKHPNVVKTLEHGESRKKEPFIVMEFIEGVGLNFLIDSHSPTLKGKRVDYLAQAADGLAYFHRQNFIHRDICPRNILVGQDGVVKLIDFGLAVPNTPAFQKPGNRTGSITHMAPELLRRVPTDERLDIFSFGVMAFECLIGVGPWEATDTLERARLHINVPPRDPREVVDNLEEDLYALLMKSLEKSPDDRIPTMKDFADALRGLSRQDY